jgi:hypothetical protein
MGDWYLEGAITGAACNGSRQAHSKYQEQTLNASTHACHQPLAMLSGDICATPDEPNARRVALVAWSLPKCPISAGAVKRPCVLSGDLLCGLDRTFGNVPSQKYWVNTVPVLPQPHETAQIDSRGGGSTPNCSLIVAE